MLEEQIKKGSESDVVISSRVRLARNFDDYPFPFKMNDEQSGEVLNRVKDAILDDSFVFIDIQDLNAVEKQALVEKHLISPDIVEKRGKSGVLISKDERISIMANEEDHLRIQSLFSGLELNKARQLCDEIDMRLEEKNDFAYSNDFGYLTCCPTNVGTGMRASVMLHLPALVMTGYIRNILEACGKLNVAVRGIYGENTEASGNMFQISNQVTLGVNEEEIIANIINITSQIIEQERLLRDELYKQDPPKFEDKVFRSYGTFANARIISADESLRLLSDVRLGVDMGIIKNIGVETLNEIMLLVQPANLQKYVGRTLGPDERDIRRSDFIRNKLNIETYGGD